MPDDYSLNIEENCGNCEKCDRSSTEFPYICKIDGRHTGELIKCAKWLRQKNNIKKL